MLTKVELMHFGTAQVLNSWLHISLGVVRSAHEVIAAQHGRAQHGPAPVGALSHLAKLAKASL